MRSLTFCLLVLLTLPWAAMAYAQAVDVSAFGAQPDTGKDSTPETINAIDFAIKITAY
jgi:uncharacterized iron-regulated membrane protein